MSTLFTACDLKDLHITPSEETIRSDKPASKGRGAAGAAGAGASEGKKKSKAKGKDGKKGVKKKKK